jgi:hypothetical protein
MKDAPNRKHLIQNEFSKLPMFENVVNIQRPKVKR